ncbi:hypothetical protein [Dokdonella immobilis]|uniref:hypothetical protein n=1 Tax=Dokdonella immobilis TaxID=578942 RepID=UPI001113C163|nr:hypothetical protein [Dokdonella immobilis]
MKVVCSRSSARESGFSISGGGKRRSSKTFFHVVWLAFWIRFSGIRALSNRLRGIDRHMPHGIAPRGLQRALLAAGRAIAGYPDNRPSHVE